MARKKRFKLPKITTVVGENTEVRGDVIFTGGLHIDGVVKGNVIAETDDQSALTVSEAGSIEGEVRVANVILNGTVKGDVHASNRVELASRARVMGTVYYSLLEMAMGAEVNGQLVHHDDREGAVETPLGADAAAEAEPSAEHKEEGLAGAGSGRVRRGREQSIVD